MAPAQPMPPGFRFHPTDEELVAYYLKQRMIGGCSASDVIGDLELYRFEPWDLPGKSLLQTRDLEWYFFSPRDAKHKHGSRTNRATEAGYWKATGKDRKVCSGSRTIGMKKTLVFYKGRAPQGDRTDWVMHEYRMDEDYEKAKAVENSVVLCRIFKKSGPGPRNGEQYGAPFIDDNDNDLISLPQMESVETFADQEFSEVQSMPLRRKEQLIPSAGSSSHFWSSDVKDDGNDYLRGMTPERNMKDVLVPPIFTEGKDGEEESVQKNSIPAVGFPSAKGKDGEEDDAQKSLIPAMGFPSGSDTSEFHLGMQSGLDDLDDILHPAPGEADMLEDILNFVNIPNSSNSPRHHAGQNLQPYAYSDLLGDFLELADLDMPLDPISLEWQQETDWVTIQEHLEQSSGEMDTGIQIRARSEQPAVQEVIGINGMGTASQRVRMQGQSKGHISMDAMNSQAHESLEIQELEGVHRHIGTESMVYTAYEQIPTSRVTVFVPAELGGIVSMDAASNPNVSMYCISDNMLAAADKRLNASVMSTSQSLQIQKSGKHHQSNFPWQMCLGVETVEQKQPLPIMLKDGNAISVPVSRKIKQPIETSEAVSKVLYNNKEHLDVTSFMGYLGTAASTASPSSVKLLNIPDQEQHVDVASLLKSTYQSSTMVMRGDLSPLTAPGQNLGHTCLMPLSTSFFTHCRAAITPGILQSTRFLRHAVYDFSITKSLRRGMPIDLKRNVPPIIAPTLPAGNSSATHKCYQNVAEKVRRLPQCHDLSLTSLSNSLICRFKQGHSLCFEGWQSWGVSASCLGNISNSFAFLFFRGSASALLSCLSRELWRLAKFVDAVS